MPEGHTLHRLAAAYRDAFAGRVTHSSSPQGRFGAEAALLDGRELLDAEAYGKHLFCRFGSLPGATADAAPGSEPIVHVHLGLLGKVRFERFTDRPPEPVGALRWRLSAEPADSTTDHGTDGGAGGSSGDGETPGVAADLRGPTACELVTPDQVDALLARLGPDPLRFGTDPLADPDRGWQRIRRSPTPIAALLMDQKVAPGVGNIYRAEVLYRHRLAPMTPGKLIKSAEWQAIWDDLVTLMRQGVQTGRIDTVRPEHEPEAMGRPPREDRHGGEVYVYRRAGQPCLVCGTPIRLKDLAGRNLFWCPKCQQVGSRRRSTIRR